MWKFFSYYDMIQESKFINSMFAFCFKIERFVVAVHGSFLHYVATQS